MMKYQIEKPSDTDMFASRGHENSALAIKDTIENHDTVHVIGLEGALGAGKSTVLKLLESNLPNDKFKFITFDVEKYHSSTKTSFIKVIHKNLINFFGQKNELDDAKNRALGNKFSYEKEVDSNLKFITAFFILAMVFAARFAPDAVKPFFDTPDTTATNTVVGTELFSLEHNLSIFFASSPLLILGLSWLLGLSCIRNSTNSVIQFFAKFPKVGDIINKNGTDKITETLLINKEVGSTELETAFKDFIESIPRDKTVILVIDNLDRVESEKVREVWSDLEIFTSLCSSKFRVIVPFSEEHIAKALSSNGESNGQEFISKRLPVVFKAPPIVSAGWREPFKHFWSETLLTRPGYNQCCELIDIWITSQEKQVTPRLLKKHVNDIATLIISNSELSPNAAVCSAYLLVSKHSNLPFKYLLSTPENIPKGIPEEIKTSLSRTQKILRKAMTDEQWAAEIMCVHFQSNEEIAKSELLDEPIRAAIKNVSSTRLFELSKLFGFKEAFDKYIELNDPYDVVILLGELLDREDIEESEKLQWIENHLATINHYLNEERFNTAPNHYDSDLVAAYRTLLDSKIDINTLRIENEALTLEKYIEDEHPLNEEELLVQLHDYSYITNSTPDLIKSADEEYFFDRLWSKKWELKNWDIESLRTSNKDTTANIEYLEENELVENHVSYFNSLKKRNKLEKHAIAQKWISLTKTAIATILNNLNGYDLLPFTNLWSGPQSCLSLLQKINGMNNKDKEYFAWVSITICYVIENNLMTTQHILTPGHQNTKVITGNFLKEKAINNLDDISKYLKNDLTFISSFQKIVDALEGQHFNDVIPSGVASAISTGRISSLITESIATAHWDTLSNLFNDDKKILVNWFSGWSKNIPTVDKWSPQLVKDVTGCSNIYFTQKIEQFLNNIDLDSEFWENCIVSPSETIIEIFTWLESQDKKVKSSANLSDGIINAFKESKHGDVEIEIDILDKILNSMPTKSMKKIVRNIENHIEANASNSDYVYWLISYFKNRITLRESLRTNYSDKTLTLFDHINSQTIADWFDNQDWNFSNLTADQTDSLISAIEELSDRYDTPNLSQLALSLKPEQSAIEDDDDNPNIEPATA
ncbi:P-loop NTPase fold protein [Vibrio diazotrophicus]|uniref:P-loop NTPase fold protein n=1 Tax=Vibrio diazotrophicus TaxID=685 RepID=UPI000C9DDE02|nr:P-loop NTPase fold protein [Vibrio diazotrophicus]PNH91327.1 hypothetical protein C1M59_14585 [Vibrio diazotrophicus]